MNALTKTISLLLLLVCVVRAEDKSLDIWSHDYTATLKKSKAMGKPALVYFSGSNWCPYCKALNTTILDTNEFKAFATERFELVNLDFPRPAPKGDKLYELNKWLREQHGVTGFPALLIMDGDGVVIGRTGYTDKGVQTFIDQLTDIINPGRAPKVVVPPSKMSAYNATVSDSSSQGGVQQRAPVVLTIKPGYVSWPKGQAPEPKVITLTVAIDEPVHVLSAISANPSINVAIDTIENGKRYQLTLLPLSTDEVSQATITILTDYPKDKPKSFYVLAKVK